jgi:hypothetical protein
MCSRSRVNATTADRGRAFEMRWDGREDRRWTQVEAVRSWGSEDRWMSIDVNVHDAGLLEDPCSGANMEKGLVMSLRHLLSHPLCLRHGFPDPDRYPLVSPEYSIYMTDILPTPLPAVWGLAEPGSHSGKLPSARILYRCKSRRVLSSCLRQIQSRLVIYLATQAAVLATRFHTPGNFVCNAC